jgi:hypothetical protein
MRCSWWLLATFLGALAFPRAASAQASEAGPTVLEKAPVVLEADGALYFGDGFTGMLTTRGPITGFAFAPGQDEIAYCAPTGTKGRWGLWVVTTVLRYPAELVTEGGSGAPRKHPAYQVPDGRPRLLWTAPPGIALRGPLWWAPSGSAILVRAFAGQAASLMGVDYATGKATRLVEGREVTAVAWSPNARYFAYTVTAGSGPEVWLQRFPPGEPRRLGPGGAALRWAGAEERARWMAPKTAQTWAQMSCEVGGEAEEADPLPVRPEGTMWSPDGRLCATLEGEPSQLVASTVKSTTGETLAFPGMHPRQLLGWSPDSRLVMLRADRDLPLMVSVAPKSAVPAYVLRMLEEEDGVTYQQVRATVAGPPMDPEAGPPSWSSDGSQLAYVYRRTSGNSDFVAWPEADPRRRSGTEDIQWLLPEAERALIVVPIGRREFPPPPPPPPTEPKDILQVKLLKNVKQIALAVNAFMMEHDTLPDATTTEELRTSLAKYLEDESVFLLPDSGEVVVEYLAPPGMKISEIADLAMLPTVVIRSLPDWDLVGFADGHAKAFPKGADYGQQDLPPRDAE